MSIYSAAFVCAETESSPIFYKELRVENPQDAAIEIAGLGFFELRINGKKVSEDLLVPPLSDYGPRDIASFHYPIYDTLSYRTYFMRYDLSSYLIKGDNTIEIQLGTGWFDQHVNNGEGKRTYGKPRLAFSLTADGKEYLSDETLMWRESEIVFDNIYVGEVHDFRNKDNVWKPVTLTEAPAGALQVADIPADRVMRTLTPTVLSTDGIRTIYDAGENISGVVTFCQTAADGDETVVRHAELLGEDGSLLTRSAGNTVQTDRYISDGGTHVCTPKFCYHGFRYFEVTGPAEDVEVLVIHMNIPETASFTSDNEVLNFLYTATVRSLYANLHNGVISDCPHRERLGYTGDGQLTADVGLTILDSASFYEKWMRDIADSQDPISGHVQHTAPFMGGGGGPGGWGGAIVIVPYIFYLHTDRLDILETYYPHMKKYIAYMESHSEDGLVVREEKKGWCLGDWCTPEDVAIPEPFVNTYFLIKALDYMVEISFLLGDFDAPWAEKSAVLRAKLRQHYYDAGKNTYCDGVQGADAFALDLGIGDVPMAEALAAKYEAMGEFDTGIFGTDILIRVLFENGFGDTALKLLTADTGNSFGTWLRRGETTLCEYWDGKASHNHHMFGAPARYLFSHLLGIDDRGEMLAIAPAEITRTGSYEGSVQTKFGKVTVSRKIDADGETITVKTEEEAFFRYKDEIASLDAGEEISFKFTNF